MTSAQLMAQAKELEKKERLDAETKEMNQLIEQYVGKCFGTSKFRQKSKASYHKAIYIEKIERYEEDKNATAAGTIVCSYQSIYVSKSLDWKNKKNTNINYTVGNYTTHLNSGTYNMFYNMHNLVDGMKEIPYNTFLELFLAGESANQVIEDAFSGNLKLEIEKTMGDSSEQSRLEESCKIAGVELIDLEKHLPLLNAIRYAELPGYMEDRFLIKSLAKVALETQIKLNQAKMSDRWCDHRRYQSFERENEVISSYIRKLKL